MTQVRLSRLETILKALWQCGGVGGCSRLEIAQMLGLKKTPYLTGLLNQVVQDGWATAEIDLSVWPHRIVYKPAPKLDDWYEKQGAA
jgi:hypothetical protein